MTLVTEFRDDDAGYLAWLVAHPQGYVINIARSYNPTDAHLHRADCPTIGGSPGGARTGPYVKECATHLADLKQWANESVGQSIRPCRRCQPESAAFHEDPHPGSCSWDGNPDQSGSSWDSLVDWADYHAIGWARWQAWRKHLLLGRPMASRADAIEMYWSGFNGSGGEGWKLACAARVVNALRKLTADFSAHPELQHALDRLSPELEQRWRCRAPVAEAISVASQDRAVSAPIPQRLPEFREDSAVVEAWADDYVPHDHRTARQDDLRYEIRNRCRQLEPAPDQVLHATFFGHKPTNADIENLLLYNIDESFKRAGRNGIRFEHGAAVPASPHGVDYRFGYRYALAPRSGTFDHWNKQRTLASFDWIQLGAFDGEPTLARVWLALSRARLQTNSTTPASAVKIPFGIRVEVRPPHGAPWIPGRLTKSLVDGVISAFQAHTDTVILPEVIVRLAKSLSVDPEEIQKHLLDQRHAVLGPTPRLVYPYRENVKWDPADHWCLAGEVVAAPALDSGWAIKGELIEVTR